MTLRTPPALGDCWEDDNDLTMPARLSTASSLPPRPAGSPTPPPSVCKSATPAFRQPSVSLSYLPSSFLPGVQAPAWNVSPLCPVSFCAPIRPQDKGRFLWEAFSAIRFFKPLYLSLLALVTIAGSHLFM